MKKILILLAFVPLMHIVCSSQTDINFNKWFTDATLRIDYLRIGSKQNDTITLVDFVKRSKIWAGSRTTLIDPFNNGEYQLKVQDSATNKIIYTKGYNTLFREYCDTPEGAKKEAKFEEVVWMPYPLNTVKITLQKRDKKQKLVDQCSWIFNPKTTKQITKNSISRQNPIEKIKISGDPHKKLDMVIVAQGYENDPQKATNDMYKLTKALFHQEPFKKRQDDFNIWGVRGDAGAEYNTFGSDRYLMTMHLFQLHDIIANIPYDHIVIMVNNEKYGGGAIYNFHY